MWAILTNGEKLQKNDILGELMSKAGVIQFNVRFPFELHQEGKWFIASCRLLDVHSQGKDKEEATRNLVEAGQLFIESCYERGTLDQVLKARGFKALHNAIEEPDKDMLNVPLNLVAENNAQACTH